MNKLPNYGKTGPGGVINAKSLSSRSKTTSMKTWVEHNSKLYVNEIKSMKEIINGQVIAAGQSDEFVSNMLVALTSGRKITDKMLNAIHNIIKNNRPEELAKRGEWVEKVVPKLMMVRELISDTNWSSGYKGNTHSFINSLIDQAKSRKTLSKKQMEAVNKVYLKIKKHLEKNKK